jgi:hypothetical protein
MQEPNIVDDTPKLDSLNNRDLEPASHADHREPSEKPADTSKNGLVDHQVANPSTRVAEESAVVDAHQQVAADASSSIPDKTKEETASPAQKQNEQAIRKSAIAAAMEAVKYAAPGQHERLINEAISAAVNPSSVQTETVAAPQRSSKLAAP